MLILGFGVTMNRTPILASLLGVLLVTCATQAAAFKCMPLYGNWCGVGHPAAGFPPPIDAFDAACMRHDFCVAGPGPEQPCDIAFVDELHRIAAQVGYLPRPLQWAEYVIRVKAGGPKGGIPMPMPGDAFGLFSSIAAPCW
jgi:hypothetical protein